jgi:hypothetical protein
MKTENAHLLALNNTIYNNFSTAMPPGQAPTLGPVKLKFSLGN